MNTMLLDQVTADWSKEILLDNVHLSGSVNTSSIVRVDSDHSKQEAGKVNKEIRKGCPL